MYFVNKEYNATLEVKKSKFITHIVPYCDFKDMMKKLKNEHPKGRHFVYAYRYLNEYEQIVQNSSDDGEPKGTSGKPALNVLSGASIINSAVIIVRYFGGIKLGTGGLVKAYSDAVNLVLEESTLIPYTKLEVKSLILSYPLLSQVEYILSLLKIFIVDKQFDTAVKLTLEASNEQFIELSKELPRECKITDE